MHHSILVKDGHVTVALIGKQRAGIQIIGSSRLHGDTSLATFGSATLYTTLVVRRI